jgi:mitotic spindle assembly checkpoint protein MAD2B
MTFSSVTICQFVEAICHHILWKRGIYPDAIFVSRLAFGVTIKASEHRGVNDFIGKALDCFKTALDTPQVKVDGIDLIITDKNCHKILEIYSLKIGKLPTRQLQDLGEETEDQPVGNIEDHRDESMTLLLRTCLLKITSRLSEIPALDNSMKECSFNFQLHTTTDGAKAISHDNVDTPWIVLAKKVKGPLNNRVTIPVHSVEDPFRLKLFIDLIKNSV